MKAYTCEITLSTDKLARISILLVHADPNETYRPWVAHLRMTVYKVSGKHYPANHLAMNGCISTMMD